MAPPISATIALPNLSAAQMMADLDSLNKCDPQAALCLMKASSRITPRQIRRLSRASILPEPQKFDSLGRRIVTPLSRINSDTSNTRSTGRSGNGSDEGGGNETGPADANVDMRRAKELLGLFEKKEDFRQMGSGGLARVKEKVDEVKEKNAQKQLDGKQRAAKERQNQV